MLSVPQIQFGDGDGDGQCLCPNVTSFALLQVRSERAFLSTNDVGPPLSFVTAGDQLAPSVSQGLSGSIPPTRTHPHPPSFTFLKPPVFLEKGN